MPPLLPVPPGEAIGDVAHIVQTALTPIFLLSGIGTLLGLFNTRLARVLDDMAHLTDLAASDDAKAVADAQRHLDRLRRRILALDASVAFGAVGGVTTCLSVFILFLGSVRGSGVASALLDLFGTALACTIASLIAFLADSLLAWHGLRREGPIPRQRAGGGRSGQG